MSQPRIALAIPVLRPGFGVSTVVRAQCRILEGAGWEVLKFALNVESDEHGLLRAPPWPWGLESIVRSLGARKLIVHGPPFLGAVRTDGPGVVVWEHGLVFPEFLAEPWSGRARRELERRSRQDRSAAVVVCPSRSLADRLGLDRAVVIPNGADHLATPAPPARGGAPVLLCVLRIGVVEEQYKGLADLLAISRESGVAGAWRFRAVVVGSGAGGRSLQEAGWEVVQAPTPEALASEFGGASVYLAPSRCESFDLPLVEAQRAGAAGIAFDGGAHVETCPHLYRSIPELAATLENWSRGGLEEAQARSQAHAIPFTWANHGRSLLGLLEATPDLPPATPLIRVQARLWTLWWKAGAASYALGRRLFR